MNSPVLVQMIAASVAIIVAALSYLFTKRKEREADWRKWKYEQYKEFVAALSKNVGPNPTTETHREFLDAGNTLNLIGSQGVIKALQALIASMNADNPREENNLRISKLIWEIRRDARIPGTPAATEFSARLWFPVPGPEKVSKGGSAD